MSGCRRLLGVVFLLLASITPALAQVAITSPPPVPGAALIGVAAAVQGAVQVATPGAVGRIVSSGQPIYLGDVVTTNAQGRLQILLLDETVFTIGPNSAIAIDEFVYDPATQAGKVGARIVNGVFRFVTGRIARRDPKAMQVKLPVGVIGIRGTMVAGRVEGEQAQIVLLGPGPGNNTGDPPGQIVVSNTIKGIAHEVTVVRPGFGTEIAGAQAFPTPPAQIPPAMLDSLTSNFTPPPPSEAPQGPSQPGESQRPGPPEGTAPPAGTAPPPGHAPSEGYAPPEGQGPFGPPMPQWHGSASDQAGQTTMYALQHLEGIYTIAQLTEFFQQQTTVIAQDAAQQSAAIADGISKMEELRTIETGVFHYEFNGVVGSFHQTVKLGSPASIFGRAEARIVIDFGSRTLGASGSYVKVDTTMSAGGNINHTEPILSHSFATTTGNATFLDPSPSAVLPITMTLNNQGGVVAKTMRVDGHYNNEGVIGFTSRNEGDIAPAITMERLAGS